MELLTNTPHNSPLQNQKQEQPTLCADNTNGKMHHPKNMPQRNQNEIGLHLINPNLTPVTNNNCKIFSHNQVHSVPNLQGKMEAAPAPAPAPVIANSPVQQESPHRLQFTPFDVQPQQESQLDLTQVQPEAIDSQQLQLISQQPTNQQDNETNHQQSSSIDSVDSPRGDEASDSSLSLQQLEDQTIATDTTQDNTSGNAENLVSAPQLPNARIIWKDLPLGQGNHPPASPHHLLQLEQVPLPDEASDSTSNSKGPYVKLQHKETGEEMITRQGLIFPPLHQDYQPVLWNRSPEEKEVFVHAKENPMASHLTPQTRSNAKKFLNFQPATCELCGSGEHHSSQCKPLTPEILFESQFCTICSAYGHDERHCPTATCSLCTQSGHTRQHCTFSPSCSFCGAIGHKETQCPTKPCSVCRMIHDL